MRHFSPSESGRKCAGHQVQYGVTLNRAPARSRLNKRLDNEGRPFSLNSEPVISDAAKKKNGKKALKQKVWGKSAYFGTVEGCGEVRRNSIEVYPVAPRANRADEAALPLCSIPAAPNNHPTPKRQYTHSAQSQGCSFLGLKPDEVGSNLGLHNHAVLEMQKCIILWRLSKRFDAYADSLACQARLAPV